MGTKLATGKELTNDAAIGDVEAGGTLGDVGTFSIDRDTGCRRGMGSFAGRLLGGGFGMITGRLANWASILSICFLDKTSAF